ncbi:hypothetical protein [Clostridium aceticum]|nr:hypothetical protein [Clostridium aceticum]
MLCIFILILWMHLQYNEALYDGAMKSYISNFYEDTRAKNAVAAIYLNYRVYDTLFEALTLLISVVGVIHFYHYEEDEE